MQRNRDNCIQMKISKQAIGPIGKQALQVRANPAAPLKFKLMDQLTNRVFIGHSTSDAIKGGFEWNATMTGGWKGAGVCWSWNRKAA